MELFNYQHLFLITQKKRCLLSGRALGYKFIQLVNHLKRGAVEVLIFPIQRKKKGIN